MAVYEEKDKKKQTKDGRKWYYRVYYTDMYGNRKQKVSKLFITKKEAKEEERKFLDENDNICTVENKLTLDKLFEEYEIYLSGKKNKSSSNYSDYENYKNHISPVLGEKKISSINLQDIRLFHTNLDNKTYERKNERLNYSHKFKTKVHSLLSCILDYGMSMGYIKENMAKRYGNFKHQNQEVVLEEEKVRYQTPSQFYDFIEVINDELLWKTFFSFLYWTGCRKGEVQSITWEDIDWEKNLIRINKTLSNKIKGGGFMITNTKNRRNRKILLLAQLKPILQEWYKYNKEFENFSEKWFIFGNTRYLANTTIDDKKNECYDLLDKNQNTKTTRFTLHEFGRHSHASLLISLEVNIETIAERLGDTVETIRKVYAHLFPTYNDELEDKITDEKIKELSIKMKKYE